MNSLLIFEKIDLLIQNASIMKIGLLDFQLEENWMNDAL